MAMAVFQETLTSNNLLDRIFQDQPGGLLREHLRRLLVVEAAEKRLHEARVCRRPWEEINRLDQYVDDARASCWKLKEDVAADLCLALRFVGEVYPELNFRSMRDYICELANIVVGFQHSGRRGRAR
jgi:hypothetical protein